MSQFPDNVRYTKTHEWVRVEEDSIVTVGITDHAQCLLGDLVFVELPEIDKQIQSGDEVAVVESVKTAADVYSPLAGKIVEINQTLEVEPGTVNQDPYGTGWLFRMKVNDLEQLNALLDAKSYEQNINEENH